jgi:hypothetical protein
MNKTVSLFIPDKAHKKIFLHTSTKCVRPSETFLISYPLSSIVVVRKTTCAERTVSVMYLFLRQIISEKNS